MKKIILFLMLLMFTKSYSQLNMDNLNKEAEKLTAAKIYSDVKDGFSRLVNNLEGPAKHVYGVYVYQHRARGISSLAVSLFLFLFFGIGVMLLWKKADFNDEEKVRTCIFFVIFCLGTIVGIGHIIDFFSHGVVRLINPEYYAIQDIIKAFK